jgi:hypothetical protein
MAGMRAGIREHLCLAEQAQPPPELQSDATESRSTRPRRARPSHLPQSAPKKLGHANPSRKNSTTRPGPHDKPCSHTPSTQFPGMATAAPVQ